MTSYVYAERTVRCPFSVAAEYAAKHLRGFERPTANPVRVPFGQFSFRVVYDALGTLRRQSDEIHFRWRAGTRWLPDCGGTLRFRIATYRDTLLILEGMYRPPFGILGAIFDELIGRAVAAATAADLLRRVGEALESDERAFRAADRPAS